MGLFDFSVYRTHVNTEDYDSKMFSFTPSDYINSPQGTWKLVIRLIDWDQAKI
jgi:hypothetical protein